MRKLTFTLVPALFMCLCAYAQNDSTRLTTIASKLSKLSSTRPIEKVYLHLNKERYEPGDTIWFKGYVTAGVHHQPSALSGPLYVELYDTGGALLKSLVLKNNNGISAGEFALDPGLPGGNYRIRAYTTYMRNFGNEYFYNVSVPVKGTAMPVTATTAGQSDLQFFPEGGELVNGVRSRIAFKAVGSNGLGVDMQGTVVDNENNVVAEFQSRHLGMGVFAFMPQAGKTYTAKLADGKLIPIIKAKDKGFVLAINTNPNDSAKLNIRVSTNEATLNENKGKSFYIIGRSGGQVYYTAAGKLDNASFTASVPKNNFPSGIAQFTLFTDANEPLNERLVFIENKGDLIDLNISSNKDSYTQKERSELNITAKDNSGKPVQGSFSLSVYHEDGTSSANNENNILSSLLLTSDLKGYIEQPGYYFGGHNTQVTADLDLLLMTQGYRRFNWTEIMNDQYPPITFQPERGLSVLGTLTDETGGPVAKGTVNLLSLKDGINKQTTTDEQGRFILSGIDIFDTTSRQVTILARTAADSKNVTIKLDKKTYPPVIAGLYSEKTLTENARNPSQLISGVTVSADTGKLKTNVPPVATKTKGNKELNEVEIKARKNYGTELAPWITVSPHSANLNGPGHADKVFTGKEFEYSTDLLESVLNKLPGIDRVYLPKAVTIDGVYYTGFVYYFARHQYQSISKPPPIRFMIDGMLVQDVDALHFLNVNEVASVEALYSGSYLSVYGTTAPGGLVIITTRNGTESLDKNGDDIKLSPGSIETILKGYYIPREFYLPKYTPANVNTSDNRTAVCWNPNVLTGADGKFNVEYFNSDVKGTYKAVIEGIDNDGNIGRYVYRYKVE